MLTEGHGQQDISGKGCSVDIHYAVNKSDKVTISDIQTTCFEENSDFLKAQSAPFRDVENRFSKLVLQDGVNSKRDDEDRNVFQENLGLDPSLNFDRARFGSQEDVVSENGNTSEDTDLQQQVSKQDLTLPENVPVRSHYVRYRCTSDTTSSVISTSDVPVDAEDIDVIPQFPFDQFLNEDVHDKVVKVCEEQSKLGPQSTDVQENEDCVEKVVMDVVRHVLSQITLSEEITLGSESTVDNVGIQNEHPSVAQETVTVAEEKELGVTVVSVKRIPIDMLKKQERSIGYKNSHSLLKEVSLYRSGVQMLSFCNIVQTYGTLIVPSELAMNMLRFLASFSYIVDESTISSYFKLHFNKSRMCQLKAEYQRDVARLVLITLIVLQTDDHRSNSPVITSIMSSLVVMNEEGKKKVQTVEEYLQEWKWYFDVEDPWWRIDSAEIKILLSMKRRLYTEEHFHVDGTVTLITKLRPEVLKSSLPGPVQRIGYLNSEELELTLAMQNCYKYHCYFDVLLHPLKSETVEVPVELLLHLLNYLILLWDGAEVLDVLDHFCAFNGELMLKSSKRQTPDKAKLIVFAFALLKRETETLSVISEDAQQMLCSLVGVRAESGEYHLSELGKFLADWNPSTADDSTEILFYYEVKSSELNAMFTAVDAKLKAQEAADQEGARVLSGSQNKPDIPKESSQEACGGKSDLSAMSLIDLVKAQWHLKPAENAKKITEESFSGRVYSDQLVQDIKEADLRFAFNVESLTNGEVCLIYKFTQYSF